MAQKWSILDQIWPNMAGLSTFQSGPKGPKKNQNGQPKCFWPFGTLTKFCYHMEFLKFFAWICQSCYMYFSPFTKQKQVEVRHRLVCWLKELNKLDAWGLLCLWQCLIHKLTFTINHAGKAIPRMRGTLYMIIPKCNKWAVRLQKYIQNFWFRDKCLKVYCFLDDGICWLTKPWGHVQRKPI